MADSSGVPFFRSRRERQRDEEIRKLVEENNRDLHPEYLIGRIIDEHEELHFKRIRRRLVLFWTIFGNMAISAAILAIPILRPEGASLYTVVLAAALILSIVCSFALLYRQYKLIRYSNVRIRKLNVAHRRNRQFSETQTSDDDGRLLVEHKRYRDELPEVIADYRTSANRYRVWHNGFQGIIIVGSVVTSAITTASVSYVQARWFAVAVSAIVGLAAGFTGYFKYRERSFNLQQTADAIEREYESVELRVGRYRNLTEPQAFAEFASYVEHLRDEQNKRQQQLDQPADVKREQSTSQ